MARISTKQANATDGMEMYDITACVVGGVTLASDIGEVPMVIVGTTVIGLSAMGSVSWESALKANL